MALFGLALGIHITSGSVGLLSGTINIIRRKGDVAHSRIGKAFFWSMLCTGFSSLLLAQLHPNYFLFTVGVFTIYMTGTGQRSLALKQIANGASAKPIDWFLTGAMLLFSLIFLGMGIYRLTQSDNFGIVLIVFGSIAMLMSKADFNHYRGLSLLKNAWLIVHIQRMTGAYIASLTAFLVVNLDNKLIPGAVAWLLPTAVLVPLIVKWSRQHSRPKTQAAS
jgi:uncharacterized membrane protein